MNMDETINVSDTNMTSDGLEINLDSPLKLSYERASSPDFDHYPSNEHLSNSLPSLSPSPPPTSPSPPPTSPSPPPTSPFPPPTSPSPPPTSPSPPPSSLLPTSLLFSPFTSPSPPLSLPSSNHSSHAASPVMYTSSSSSPQSPISSYYSNGEPPPSPSYSFTASPRLSPPNYNSNSHALSPDSSSSSSPMESVYMSPASPHQSRSSPSFTYRTQSPSNLDYRVMSPQSPLTFSNSNSPNTLQSSPYQSPLYQQSPLFPICSPPHIAPACSLSPPSLEFPPSPQPRSVSPLETERAVASLSCMDTSPCHSETKPPLNLGDAASTSSAQSAFHSFSPKTERPDIQSPSSPLCPSTSSAPVTSAADPSRPVHEDTFLIEVDHHSPLTSTCQEVVVEDDPPCVVDLTCEEEDGDDDIVEIVSTKPPVVCIESETRSRRHHRKRRRHESQSRTSAPSGSEEPIVIHDMDHDNPSGEVPPPPLTVTISGTPSAIAPSTSQELPNPSSSGVRNTPQLFGDLLNQSVVPLDQESVAHSRISCTCVQFDGRNRTAASAALMAPQGMCGIHGLSSTREPERAGSRVDRARSPLRPPESGASRSLIEAPIPQDVLEDIASLYARPPLFRHPFRFNASPRSPTGGPEGSATSGSLMETSSVPQDILHDFASVTASSRPKSFIHRLLQEARSRVPPSPPPYSESNVLPRYVQPQGSSLSSLPAAAVTKTTTASALVPPPDEESSDAAAGASAEDSGGLSCPICFESVQEIKKEGKSFSSTVCGHIFCTGCLEASFKRAKQCPTCRKRLNKKQYHPLYI